MRRENMHMHFSAKHLRIFTLLLTLIAATGLQPAIAGIRVEGVKEYLIPSATGPYSTLRAATSAFLIESCGKWPAFGCQVLTSTETYDAGSNQWVWGAMFSYSVRYSDPDIPPSGPYTETTGGLINWDCPLGFHWDGWAKHGSASCSKPDQPEPDCGICKAPRVGNPILLSTGVKEQIEVDYIGANGLRFVRTYMGDRNKWRHNYQLFALDFAAAGAGVPAGPDDACYQSISQRGKSYCYRYVSPGSGQSNDIAIMRSNGRMLNFGTTANLAPKADINDRICNLTDSAGAAIGRSVYNSSEDSTERYDTGGRLQAITARNGQVQALNYSDVATPPGIAPKAGLLTSVADWLNTEDRCRQNFKECWASNFSTQ